MGFFFSTKPTTVFSQSTEQSADIMSAPEYVNLLHNACQSCLKRRPQFIVTASGPENQRVHRAVVYIDDMEHGTGTGPTQMAAKHVAAYKTLVMLLNDDKFKSYLIAIGFSG
ncbi:hypothetical protein NLJ89_g4564 [Agrocybe chaxingu]|uniref:DRBM domain-containing protein n=1 Tax=Agrocybe chaxingu TaxID=84603 RepID=A0A9W8MUF8_9AGAR|nr:hypothetical protein NLJ89_g4564 [Agrocybe chaxingu]